MNENNSSTVSFDRMRNMMMRAAEVRESEQQQIFDALDEIHARLSPVESLGSVRKRLSELPDRTEMSVLAERLDETLAKLEAQDTAIAGLNRAVDSVVDKLAKPFAELDGRLDGVSGRFEGVAGRMDGLEDKLGHIHKRLDDLDHHLERQDDRMRELPREVHVPVRERIDAMETALRGRIDEVGEGVHEHIDGTREALYRSVTEGTENVGARVEQAREALHNRLGESQETLFTKLSEANDTLHGKLDSTRDTLRARIDAGQEGVQAKIEDARAALDAAERLEALAAHLEQVTNRLDALGSRLDAVENGVGGRIGELAGNVEKGLSQVRGTVTDRPDSDALLSLVRSANEESERRHAGQLDEAMATFAELILGGGAPSAPPPPTALPRAQRRARGPKSGKAPGKELMDLDQDIAEGA